MTTCTLDLGDDSSHITCACSVPLLPRQGGNVIASVLVFVCLSVHWIMQYVFKQFFVDYIPCCYGERID